MPVRIERKETAVSAAAIRRLAGEVNLNPTGVLLTQAADPYAISVPRELKEIGIVGCWARKDNIKNKEGRYGAKLVDYKDVVKWGLRPDQADKVNGYINHATDKDVVLMYYPNPELLIRRNALAPHAAIQQYLSQADIAAFESQNKDARNLDKNPKNKARSYPKAFEPERLTEAEWEARQMSKPSITLGPDNSLRINDPEGVLSGVEPSLAMPASQGSGTVKDDAFSMA